MFFDKDIDTSVTIKQIPYITCILLHHVHIVNWTQEHCILVIVMPYSALSGQRSLPDF